MDLDLAALESRLTLLIQSEHQRTETRMNQLISDLETKLIHKLTQSFDDCITTIESTSDSLRAAIRTRHETHRLEVDTRLKSIEARLKALESR